MSVIRRMIDWVNEAPLRPLAIILDDEDYKAILAAFPPYPDHLPISGYHLNGVRILRRDQER